MEYNSVECERIPSLHDVAAVRAVEAADDAERFEK